MLGLVGSKIRTRVAAVAGAWWLAASPAGASVIDYHTTNIQLLRGHDYKFADDERTIATLEHYNKWTYGDFFMFVDATRFDNGNDTAFAEFSPRISLSKVSSQDWSFGPVKDVYLSGTYEKGRRDIEAYLIGGAVDFDAPGFQVLRLDLYQRDDPRHDGNTWQMTWVWKYPFEAFGLPFVTEGFADIAGDEGLTYEANQFIVPRVLLDVGQVAGGEEGRWYAGVEYQYWHNKFGVKGVTESVPQLQVKWVFDK